MRSITDKNQRKKVTKETFRSLYESVPSCPDRFSLVRLGERAVRHYNNGTLTEVQLGNLEARIMDREVEVECRPFRMRTRKKS